MKKLTKITAVILALIMAASCLVIGASALSFTDVRTTTPVILIRGQGASIYSADGELIYPVTVPDGYIEEACEVCLPLFKDAVASGDYSAWSEALVGYVADIYKDLQLDCNGEATDGSHIIQGQYTDSELYQRASWWYNNYTQDAFMFFSDWRLDPYYNADLLQHRIDVVKAATGAEKVALVARCEGTAHLAAYLDKYGTNDVETAVFYAGTLGGLEAVSGAFSGNFSLDADVLTEFYESQNITIEDDVINNLINTSIDFLQEIYGLDIACTVLHSLAPKLYKEAVYECMLRSYGTFPGIWTLVSADDYEDAKEGIFAGREEEYAGLIEKLDYYHEHVAVRYDEILKNAEEDGVNIAVVADYGDYLMKPICEDNYALSDGAVALRNQSLGATTADRGTTFTSSYLAKAKKNGTDKYIAADNMVDASTCLFPDTTWFICNTEHSDFIAVVDDLINTFINSKGEMTVDTDENYPQFLYAENTKENNGKNATIVPLTEENCMQPDEEENLSPSQEKQSMKEKVFAFLKSFFTFILRLFNNYEKTGSFFG